MTSTKVADLTLDELRAFLRDELCELIREAVHEALAVHKNVTVSDQWGILEIPPLHVEPGHPALSIMSREEMYGDE